MSLISAWRRKICVPLDGFLWRKNITHHLIRPLLRNLILAAGAAVLAGGALYAVYPSLFWAAMGLCCMAWIFWSWARLFLRAPLPSRGGVLLPAVLAGFGLRLVLIAALLYIALAVFNASPIAVIAGMTAGVFLALASCAWHMRNS